MKKENEVKIKKFAKLKSYFINELEEYFNTFYERYKIYTF